MKAPPCPCGLPRAYLACCGRYHEGPLARQAPDAESLMRSRYAAFVLRRHDYLLATWHSSTRPPDLADDPPGFKWLGLTVKSHERIDADHARVEFVARSRPPAGRAIRHHELSRFTRENGSWYYVDGDLRDG